VVALQTHARWHRRRGGGLTHGSGGGRGGWPYIYRVKPKARQQRCANAAPYQGTTALTCSGGTACAAVPVGEMASGVELTHARRRGLGRARMRSRGGLQACLGRRLSGCPKSEMVGEGAAPLTFTGRGGAGWVSAGTRATDRSQIGPCIRSLVVHSKHFCAQSPTSTQPPKPVSEAARNVSGPRLRRARPPRPNAHEYRPWPPNPCRTPCARRPAQPTYFFRARSARARPFFYFGAQPEGAENGSKPINPK